MNKLNKTIMIDICYFIFIFQFFLIINLINFQKKIFLKIKFLKLHLCHILNKK